jgi:ribosome biogenesis GTPase
VRCTLRGTLKRERRGTDPAAVGDRVRITTMEGETDPPQGVIEEVMPRVRSLSRMARGAHDREQVIVANPDQLVAVFSPRHPEPHPRLVDRFLLLAEARDLAALICVNKLDLGTTAEIDHVFGQFRAAGYPVLETSAYTAAGLDELRAALQGKISAFAGPSGVGKSSLLNALTPDIETQRTGEISSATGKGRHTTTWTTLFRISPDTWVADTPGIRQLRLWGVDFNRLDTLYPEFRPYLGECHYDDCRHLSEPGCAVREALEAGLIHPERYESYTRWLVGEQS